MCLMVRNSFLTLLRSFHVWVTWKIHVNFRYRMYSEVLMIVPYRLDFHNFFTIYVFEIKESIADIPTMPTCLNDLGNSGQLPVQEELRSTVECVLKNFIISSRFITDFFIQLSCFSDLENLGQLPVQWVLGGIEDCVLWLFTIFHYLCFCGQGIHC